MPLKAKFWYWQCLFEAIKPFFWRSVLGKAVFPRGIRFQKQEPCDWPSWLLLYLGSRKCTDKFKFSDSEFIDFCRKYMFLFSMGLMVYFYLIICLKCFTSSCFKCHRKRPKVNILLTKSRDNHCTLVSPGPGTLYKVHLMLAEWRNEGVDSWWWLDGKPCRNSTTLKTNN